MITTERSKLIGSHVTKEVRDALREEATRLKVSVSRLVYEILREWVEKHNASNGDQ